MILVGALGFLAILRISGISLSFSHLYDCEQSAQDDILDSGQEEEYNDKEDKLSKFAALKF